MSPIVVKILSSIVSPILSFLISFSPFTYFISGKNVEISKTFDKIQYEEQLVPQLDKDGDWCFTTDEKFKILQIADVHIGGGCFSLEKDKKAMNAVAAMVTAEKPDLVVFTGDATFPFLPYSGTCDNKISAEMFINMMESLGCYWAMCFGNHETEAYSYYDIDEVLKWYTDKNLKYCLFQDDSPEVDGHSNQLIKVKNSKGIITQGIILLDSHAYTDNDYFGLFHFYDYIHDNQIEWYKNQIIKMDNENKSIDPQAELVKTLLFQHIPLEEYKTAWYEYKANGYKDTENVQYVYGKCGENNEAIECSKHDTQMFETILEMKSTQGVFVGHDHMNNFSVIYKGVRLTYGMSIDYLAYIGLDKVPDQRGCTVIEVQPDGSFNCHQENYYQDKYVTRFPKEVL